jgi:hypothetical protein
MEVPKDRSSLSNMRVIRRNLVYAVGLPPNAATEEVLKRPEYFGQYGKISKVVTNRSHPSSAAEVRRASASAYVTFLHKEDTLSCILALDGFYLDGRNIRASYGTSKYCSAFIKNVRCNNPECTYLHEMGAAEDTFTKQEIQAGYVTSGRDVLARQQQLLAEQVRSGQAGSVPRKRVGGGGPSGTGKATSNPIFPPPEYDEPVKPTATLVPPPAGVARAVTTSVSLNPSSIAAKLGRSSSVSVPAPSAAATVTGKSPPLGSSTAPALAAQRKPQGGSPSLPSPANPQPTMNLPTTAASVVATGRAGQKTETDSHSTLTPLTPLKRSSVKTAARATGSSSSAATTAQQSGTSSVEEEAKLTPLRNGTNKKPANGIARSSSVGVMTSAPASPSAQQLHHSASSGPSLIGGDVIGAPTTLKPRSASLIADLGGEPLGPSPEELNQSPSGLGGAFISALGGEVFTGQLPSRPKSAIGCNSHKWSSVGQIGGAASNTPAELNDGALMSGPSSPGLLQEGYPASVSSLSATANHPAPAIGGSVIGGSRVFPSSPNGNSSSALASLLGISLPTGSGSLQESSSLWLSAPSAQVAPQEARSHLSALNGGVGASHDFYGNRSAPSGSSLIGGVPIGTSSAGFPGGGGGSNVNDITLLQSLLPGVHITSGSDTIGFGRGGDGGVGAAFGGSSGWSTAAPGPAQSMGLGPNGLPAASGWNSSGGFAHSSTGSAIGAIGHNGGVPPGQRRGPGIW